MAGYLCSGAVCQSHLIFLGKSSCSGCLAQLESYWEVGTEGHSETKLGTRGAEKSYEQVAVPVRMSVFSPEWGLKRKTQEVNGGAVDSRLGT